MPWCVFLSGGVFPGNTLFTETQKKIPPLSNFPSPSQSAFPPPQENGRILGAQTRKIIGFSDENGEKAYPTIKFFYVWRAWEFIKNKDHQPFLLNLWLSKKYPSNDFGPWEIRHPLLTTKIVSSSYFFSLMDGNSRAKKDVESSEFLPSSPKESFAREKCAVNFARWWRIFKTKKEPCQSLKLNYQWTWGNKKTKAQRKCLKKENKKIEVKYQINMRRYQNKVEEIACKKQSKRAKKKEIFSNIK